MVFKVIFEFTYNYIFRHMDPSLTQINISNILQKVRRTSDPVQTKDANHQSKYTINCCHMI